MSVTLAVHHSSKGWLDSLAKQAHFADADIDTLLYWPNSKMHRRYDRNPKAGVLLRQKVDSWRCSLRPGNQRVWASS